MRSKEVFTKHCDSVLQKTAKLRSLQSDLAKHYDNTDEVVRKQLNPIFILYRYIYCLFWTSIDLYTLWIYTLHQPGGLPHWIASYCVHFPRSAKALDMDIGKLDDSYNKLTEVMAEGERDDYNVACLGSKLISQLLFFGQQIYSIYQWENLFEIYAIGFWFDLGLRWKAKSEKAMKESTFLCRPQTFCYNRLTAP